MQQDSSSFSVKQFSTNIYDLHPLTSTESLSTTDSPFFPPVLQKSKFVNVNVKEAHNPSLEGRICVSVKYCNYKQSFHRTLACRINEIEKESFVLRVTFQLKSSTKFMKFYSN